MTAAIRLGNPVYDLWLGREDSNLRMAESKSAALPLGDAPNAFGGPRPVQEAARP
jgi:hypothetical protein